MVFSIGIGGSQPGQSGGGGGGTSLTVEDDSGNTIASVGTLQMLGVLVSGTTPSAITNMTTITGDGETGTIVAVGILLQGGGGTNSNAGGVYLGGGNAGTAGFAGSVVARAGNGGPGTYSQAGNIHFAAGDTDATGSDGEAGRAQFFGGVGYGDAKGGRAGFYGGPGYGLGQAGNAILRGGGNYGGGPGGDVVATTGGGTPAGRFLFNSDPSLIVGAYSWVAGALLNNQTIFTTTRAMVVTAVIGRLDAANGSAATLVIVKAASGTAPTGGTALTSDAVDLDGAPDTNQTLTLSATLADITLAPGDSLCMVTTGALTLSAGCITVWGTPQ